MQKFTAVIWREAGDVAYSAMCPELDVHTYGNSPEHAQEMLKEAIELFLRDEPVQIVSREVRTLEVAA